MNTRNLDQWLGKTGLLPKSEKKPTPSTSSSPKKTTSSGKKPAKAVSPSKPAPRSKGHRSSSSSQPAHKTNHNPLIGRSTVEKKERQHPTHFLRPKTKPHLRVVPLGGMEEVGFNMMFIESDQDIIIIDAGLVFPSAQHLGVDLLIPDISYLKKNKHKIRGIIVTHGHLDHIGAIPYISQDLGFPKIYCTRLTKELILSNSEEHLDTKKLNLLEIHPQSKIRLGMFECEFFHLNHSIPENVGVCVNTPYGAIVHSSDFKIDHNPSDDVPADLARMAEIGRKGVILAMVDSTNSTKSGHTLSESVIERTLEKVVERTRGRLILTTFASNIGRLAKIIEAAERNGRTVFTSGRSMEKNIAIAKKLNYLKCKDNTIQRMNRKANTMPPEKVMILSTGSQGEELAALTRMAAGMHKEIKLNENDNIIFSSSTIPGNELAIVSVLNNLAEIGCRIIDKEELDVYVSGHGNREELKLFTSLVNPKYFAPVHGEVFMRYAHRDMVIKELGFNPRNTLIMKNGQGVVLNDKGVRLMTEKEKLPVRPVMIELKEELKEHVLSDRTQMAHEGAIFVHIDHQKGTVKNINIRARGFIYMGLQHEIFKLLEGELKRAFQQNYDPARPESAMENTLQKIAEKLLLQKFKKEPLIEIIL